MRLEATVALLAGDGAVEVIKWEPSMPPFPGSGSSSALPPPPPVTAGAAHGRRSRPQSAGAASRAPSRPQSAAPGLRAYMGANGPTSERLGPRIGAFEVCYKLVNTRSGQQYGPVPVFSKISSGKWPGEPAILVKRVQEHLQGFLARDTGNNLMFQHVRAPPACAPRRRPLRRPPAAARSPALAPRRPPLTTAQRAATHRPRSRFPHLLPAVCRRGNSRVRSSGSAPAQRGRSRCCSQRRICRSPSLRGRRTRQRPPPPTRATTQQQQQRRHRQRDDRCAAATARRHLASGVCDVT
jgi:hypothetical protein